MYIIYSTRHSGWATSTGQFSSDYKEGMQYTFTDALAACKARNYAGKICFPVLLSDMERV